MQKKSRVVALVAAVIVLALSACVDKKAEQSKAFVDFLQSRILDKPGVHIPILSDEEREKIGPYAADYAILKGFHDDLNVSLAGFAKSMHPAPPNVAPLDLPRYKPDFIAARAFLAQAGASIDAALAKAQAARAKLHQPEPVKAKFDAAFDRMVSEPAEAFRGIIPVTVPILDDEIRLADFIEAHRADLQMSGGRLEVANEKLREEMQAIVKDYEEKFAKAQEARDRLTHVMEGR